MKHIIYIAPNSDIFDNNLLEDLKKQLADDPSDFLARMAQETSRQDGMVEIFDTTEALLDALNEDKVSDQGYFLLADDNISDHQHILDLIKKDCIAVGVECRKDDRTQYVIDLLPGDGLDYDEAKAAQDALCPELPVYMVASNRDGDWFEKKVRRVTCFADGQPEFQLESGYWLDATEPFIENLVSLEYILKKLCPSDVKEFHEKYA